MEWLSNRCNSKYSQHSRQQSSWLGRVVWFVLLFAFLSFGFSSFCFSIISASTPPTSGLKLWLDAKDSSSVETNGSNVTKWNDKSGNNNHAYPVGSPTYSTDKINFDGSSYFYLNKSSELDVNSDNNKSKTLTILFFFCKKHCSRVAKVAASNIIIALVLKQLIASHSMSSAETKCE